MQIPEKTSITLPPALSKLVREKVAAGEYVSNSEIVREALRIWKDREELRSQKLAELKDLIDESLSDPRPSVPAAEVFESLRKRYQ